MSGGWIKLYRDILAWEWWDDPIMVKSFLAILLKANRTPFRWRGMDFAEGQFVTSLANLSQELRISIHQVRLVLERLVASGEIKISATNRYTVITVSKWDDYQCDTQNDTDKELNNNGLGDSGGKQTANKRQTNGKQTATVQEYKNIKKVSPDGDTKESAAPKSTVAGTKARPASPQDVIDYCVIRNNGIDGQYFFDKMEARGWVFRDGRPVKDWKACVRTWEKYGRDFQKTTPGGTAHPDILLEDTQFAPNERGLKK